MELRQAIDEFARKYLQILYKNERTYSPAFDTFTADCEALHFEQVDYREAFQSWTPFHWYHHEMDKDNRMEALHTMGSTLYSYWIKEGQSISRDGQFHFKHRNWMLRALLAIADVAYERDEKYQEQARANEASHVTRITLEVAHNTTMEHDEPDGSHKEYVHDSYETLTLDYETDTVEMYHYIGLECSIYRRYHAYYAVSGFLDDCVPESFLVESKDPLVQEDVLHQKVYAMRVEFNHRPPVLHTGTYDTRGLPQGFQTFLWELKNTLGFYESFEIMDTKLIDENPKEERAFN